MNKRLKVVFVAAHDSSGGAARAAYRVFSALREFESNRLDIVFRVVHKTIDDPGIIGGKPHRNAREYAEYWLRTRFRKYFPRRPFTTANPVLHSQALYPTGLGREINDMRPDVVLMGWLGNAVISIPEIGRIRAPIVWRLSDLWVLAGAEHLTSDARYRVGYSRKSRPSHESGPDINRETFLRKKRHWWRGAHIVALSEWQLRQVRLSTLTSQWPARVIPVPIDPDFWKPVNAATYRKSLGLSEDALLIVFGAGAGTKHQHKGADLLFDALPQVIDTMAKTYPSRQIHLAIFGDDEERPNVGALPTHFLGRLNNEQLREIYSAADVVVVPSRQESFGQVAAEAQTCGAPTVVFDNSGLADVVEDKRTGRIVPAFDISALAEAIVWVLSDDARRLRLRRNARERSMNNWSPETVAKQYADILIEAAHSRRGRKRIPLGR